MFLRQVCYVLLCMQRQKIKPSKLHSYQLRRVRELVKYAHENVKHYANSQYQQQIQTLEEIERLPLIHKKDLKEAGIDGFTDPKVVCRKSTVVCRTSGSTGEPIKIYHDGNTYDYHTAAGVRRVLATGKYRPYYRLLHIRPIPLERRLFERFGLFRRKIIPAYTPINKIKEQILREAPDGLVSYPVYLRDIISVLAKQERDQIRKHLKIIFTESEILTDHQREYIQSYFGVEIFDDYSAYESLSITFECRCHRHHIVEDRLLLEVVDDQGRAVPDGAEGNIVLTSFFERAMPLIRYSIGDRGVRSSEPCPCGRTFRTLILTQGRAEECLLLKNGEKIYSATMLHLAAQLEGASDVCICQEKKGELTVYYVPINNETDNEATENFIRDYFANYVGKECELKICATKAVPRTKGGKARLIYTAP